MRNVTIVVPVLITSCHVELKWNSGPVAAHTTTTSNATANADGCPAASAMRCAKRSKRVCSSW